MRSKSPLAWPRAEDGEAVPAEQRKLPPRGPLTLVGSTQGEPGRAKKHGLY